MRDRSQSTWKEANLQQLKLPDNIDQLIKDVEIKQKTANIEGVETFVQTADPPTG